MIKFISQGNIFVAVTTLLSLIAFAWSISMYGHYVYTHFYFTEIIVQAIIVLFGAFRVIPMVILWVYGAKIVSVYKYRVSFAAFLAAIIIFLESHITKSEARLSVLSCTLIFLCAQFADFVGAF